MKTLTVCGVLLIMIGVNRFLLAGHAGGDYESVPKQNMANDIDRGQAIKIAQQYAKRMSIDPAGYDATACDTDWGWRVYLEPAAPEDPKVMELIITKRGGGVLRTITLSGQTMADAAVTGETTTHSIAEAEALAIAKKDLRHDDVSGKQLTVCELKRFWRIIYSPPPPLDGGGPEFLIHKATGRIADKRRYQ
jgi:putative NIF3 family GTP cyclohydrolase 1 type 2